MKFPTFVVYFLLGLAADLYIWNVFAFIPTLVILCCLPFIGSGRRYTDAVRIFSYVYFIFELPKILYALLSLILPGFVAAAVGICVGLFFATMIFYVSRHLVVNRLELDFEGLPDGFDGLKFCQLSDFHLGSYGRNSRYVTRIIDTALKLSPELILFTGDLVNFDISETDTYMDELARLKAPMGVYAIRGNHDYLLHGPLDEPERVKATERLNELERGLGWRVLLNENVTLERGGSTIALAGVENISANPFFARMGGDLGKALEGIPQGAFTILLSHDPSHWSKDVAPRGDVALTLSGHTHGLKYKLAGFRPSHWRLPYHQGVFTEGGSVLHVSGGLGSAFAFRLGGYPRIDMITLRKKH